MPIFNSPAQGVLANALAGLFVIVMSQVVNKNHSRGFSFGGGDSSRIWMAQRVMGALSLR